MNRFVRTLALAAALAPGARGETPSLEDRVKSLESRLGTAPVPGGAAPLEAYFKDGLQFRTQGGEFEGHVGGTLVFNARFYFRNNERVSPDSFLLRQARLVLEGRLLKDWEFRIQPTASSGAGFVVDDGYLGFSRWRWLNARIGQFKAPFGLEELQLDAYTDFPERSVSDRLTPSREVGLQVHGEPLEKVLGYAVMVSNGTGRAADDNSDKDVAARIWARPGATSDAWFIKGLHAGVAATWGRQDRAAGVLPYTYSSPTTLTTFATAGPGASSAKFDSRRSRGGVELAWLAGPFKVQGEWIVTRERYTMTGPRYTHHSVHHSGGYALASLLLTGEDPSWERVRPKRPLFGEGGGFGAVSVGVRASWLRIGNQVFEDGVLNRDRSASAVDEYVFGVNWYPNQNVRINLAYAWVKYHGDHLDPVVVKGKDFSAEDVLILRAQVDF